jgi:hypothetical protein
VFATIQTVRQLLSIVLSILFFSHPINAMESLGIGLVFSTLAFQIFTKYQASKQAAEEQVQLQPTTPNDEPSGPCSDTENGVSSTEEREEERSAAQALLRG